MHLIFIHVLYLLDCTMLREIRQSKKRRLHRVARVQPIRSPMSRHFMFIDTKMDIKKIDGKI